MASLDPTVQSPEEEQAESPSKDNMNKASQEEELDLEIAVKLGQKLMHNAGGLEAIKKAVSSTQDPVQVVSKFLVQLIFKIKDAVAQEGVDLNPSIVLGQGGWLVQMLDLLEQELGLPQEWSDGIVDDVIETFKALAQGGKGGAASPAQGQQQASPPQQGAPQPMMAGG